MTDNNPALMEAVTKLKECEDYDQEELIQATKVVISEMKRLVNEMEKLTQLPAFDDNEMKQLAVYRVLNEEYDTLVEISLKYVDHVVGIKPPVRIIH